MNELITILVADRNRHVRELLRRELTAEGYRVEVAKDGQEVELALRASQRPDLLILDLEIPYLDELAKHTALYEGELLVPLIVYSNLSDDSEGRALPAAAIYLERKEDMERLKAAVAEAVARFYPNGRAIA